MTGIEPSGATTPGRETPLSQAGGLPCLDSSGLGCHSLTKTLTDIMQGLPAGLIRILPAGLIRISTEIEMMSKLREFQELWPTEYQDLEVPDIDACFISYLKLVQEIADDISKDPSFDKDNPESFIKACSRIFHDKLKIKYSTNTFGLMSDTFGLMSRSLKTGHFDCDTSAFLALDVGKKLGIQDLSIVLVPVHSLLRVGDLYFETTKIEPPFREEKFRERYHCNPFYLDTVEKLQSHCWVVRGQALGRLRHFDDAQENYSRAIEYAPHNPIVWHSIGRELYATGSFDKAIEIYNKAIEINPYDIIAWRTLASALYARGRLVDAFRSCNMALQIDPDDVIAWSIKGRILEDVRCFKEPSES